MAMGYYKKFWKSEGNIKFIFPNQDKEFVFSEARTAYEFCVQTEDPSLWE